MNVVTLEFPPKSAYVGVIRLAVATLARGAGLDEERVDDLKIAVSEACANAVLSGEQGGSQAPITVAWDPQEERIVLEVLHRRDPSSVPPADVDLSERLSLSMSLLNTLVDDCEVVDDNGSGRSRVRLTVWR